MAFEIQDSLKKSFKNHERKAKSEALKKKKVPKEYRGNTNSEGGISFGKKP